MYAGTYFPARHFAPRYFPRPAAATGGGYFPRRYFAGPYFAPRYFPPVPVTANPANRGVVGIDDLNRGATGTDGRDKGITGRAPN